MMCCSISADFLHGHNEHCRGPEAAAEEKLWSQGPFWSEGADP